MSGLRLPAEQFYWGVLDTGSLPPTPPGSPKRRTQLGYLFESVLPVPIESVHAVYVPVAGAKVLACGMDVGELAERGNEGWVTLGPQALPSIPGYRELGIDSAAINLLWGRFESPVVRRHRRRWALHAGMAALVLTGLLVVGVERRVARAHNEAGSYRDLRKAVYERVLPPAGLNAQPDEARFLSLVRTLERTRVKPTEGTGVEDVLPAFAALLSRWPEDLQAQTHNLSVGPGTVSLTTVVPDNETAQRLISALGDPDGWRVTQDSVSPTREGVQLRRAWTGPEGSP